MKIFSRFTHQMIFDRKNGRKEGKKKKKKNFKTKQCEVEGATVDVLSSAILFSLPSQLSWLSRSAVKAAFSIEESKPSGSFY
jgi:hypothetical protein